MVLKKYISLLFLFSLLSGPKALSQCLQIKSIAVDACGATEGFDEMVRFETNLFGVNSNTMVVSWPGNAWQGVVQNAATAAVTATFNANIAAAGGCGQLIEPIGGVIPFNSTAILFTSYLVNPAAIDFGALNQNIYVIYQNNALITAGHFANSGLGIRTLTITAGACSDTVSYDRALLVGNDGAAVNYTDSGTPSYVNNGCTASIPFSVDAGATQTVCPGSAIVLSGLADGESTISWSAPSGTFSNSAVLNPTYTSDTAATGTVVLTLTITDSCGNAISDTVTVNLTPVITPNFPPLAPFCAASNVLPLDPVSPNGVSGTWNPSAIDNTGSADYVFTPDAGQCAVPFTLSVTVIPNTVPDFANPITICSGNTPPALNTVSPNGVTGTWSPSTIDNMNSGAYFFTPTTGQCATWLMLVVTVTTSTSIIPDFPASLTVCSGSPAPPLNAVSPNGITGSWSPAIISTTAAGNYTFTPNPGQCALPMTMTTTISNTVVPNFATSLSICSGATPPILNDTSPNGITGTWSPTTINNTTSGTYTFTPNVNQCASPVTLSVTVSNNIVPNFATSLSICNGSTPPVLSNTSPNGITGTWSPTTINNTASGNYIFTPNAGQCASPMTVSVTVSSNIVPNFATSLSICSGSTPPILNNTSPNGIVGNWSPSTINNTLSGTYTFTPNAGQCAMPMTLTVTVGSNIIPDFPTSLSVCTGGSVPTLNSVSPNGITGSWSPSTINNTTSGSYTFTPNGGQCASPMILTVTVGSNIVPDFPTSLSVCTGGSVPILNNTSPNGISGIWSPSTINNTASGSYTFTPNAGQCASPMTLTVTVGSNIVPDFPTSLSVCAGAPVPTLNNTSPNGITGTWNPSTINNTTSGTYLFTPNSGQCASPITLTVTVGSNIVPDFATSLSVCTGGSVPTLNTVSPNGITGSWNPSIINNTTSGTYTFTPNAGQCASSMTLTVTVGSNIVPDFPTSLSVCAGAPVPTLNNTSPNGITGSWSPSTINNTTSGTYTFTPNAGQCASPMILTVTVGSNIVPDFPTSLSVCTGGSVPTLNSVSPNGISGSWNPSTINNTISGTYTFTPNAGQCASPITLTVTVGSNIVPDFATSISVCTGGSVPTLNTVSPNGIVGSWNPSTINNTTSGTYTFTPNAGQCASPMILTVTVGSNIVPDFPTSLSVCTGGSVPTLNNTSPNGITGSWNPSIINNTTSGSYIFTPNVGQCASPMTLTVTVGSNIIPDFATSLLVCTGGSVPTLNSVSPNGIVGTWNPSTINNTTSGTYTFTPNAGQCASSMTLTVTVGNNIVPDFATALSVCTGGSVPTLNNISPNGITGSWNPSTINNTTSGTYTFTPNAGQCAMPTTLTVTVTNSVNPITTFTYATPVCNNSAAILPITIPGFTTGGQFTSDSGLAINAVSGQINVSASAAGSHTITYTVTANGACGLPGQHSFAIFIDSAPIPILTGNQAFCVGSSATLSADIPGGTWQSSNPSVVAIDNAGHISTLMPGQSTITYSVGANCPVVATKTISVYAPETPKLADGFICIDNVTGNPISTLLLQTGIPNLGHTFSWTHNGNPLPSTGNSHLANQPGLYEVVVTNTITGCVASASASVGISSVAIADAVIGQDFAHNQTITVNVTGGSGQYEFQLNDGPFQNSNIFTGISEGEYTITVNDINGCQDLILTVYALNYPRFFTPNGDGINDFWTVDGLGQQASISIFDRYGKLLKRFHPATDYGWDGTYNGEPMPSSDYWFKLDYVDRLGNAKEFRGHFSLKR